MSDDTKPTPASDAQAHTRTPAQTRTPARAGQPGNENQTRPGPSPRSQHPSGPHAPYAVDDIEGAAALKHDPVPPDSPAKGDR